MSVCVCGKDPLFHQGSVVAVMTVPMQLCLVCVRAVCVCGVMYKYYFFISVHTSSIHQSLTCSRESKKGRRRSNVPHCKSETPQPTSLPLPSDSQCQFSSRHGVQFLHTFHVVVCHEFPDLVSSSLLRGQRHIDPAICHSCMSGQVYSETVGSILANSVSASCVSSQNQV